MSGEPTHERSALQGRAVDLVPLGLVRLELLYEMALVGGAGTTWRTRGRTVSFDQFAAWLWEGGECAFGVAERGSGDLVGFVGLYGVDAVSGVGSLSAFFDPRRARVRLLAGDALESFCRYVFSIIGLRKLNIEIPSALAAGVAAAAGRLDFVVHEGTLRGQVRMGADHHDVALYAVWADAFLAWDPATGSGPAAPVGGADDGGGADELAQVRARLVALAPGPVPDPLPGGYRLADDLGLDSLAVLELVVGLEVDLGTTFPADALGSAATVQDLVTLAEVARQRRRTLALEPGSEV